MTCGFEIALKYKVAFLNQPLAYYNHDVEQENRAVVYGRVYPPHQHFIFNLEYLESEEHENTSLKKLLDALRVYVFTSILFRQNYPRDCENGTTESRLAKSTCERTHQIQNSSFTFTAAVSFHAIGLNNQAIYSETFEKVNA